MSEEAQVRFVFPGRASDGEAAILETGTGDATAALLVFFGKSQRGEDADWLRWHAFDHMPEQFRVGGVRNGQDWVSTPPCRAARLVEAEPFDRVDIVVQYLFAEPAPQVVRTFSELGAALGGAGRRPASAKLRGVMTAGYDVTDRQANPSGALGAYALPWYPARGIYLTIETSAGDPEALTARAEMLKRLVAVEGVAGAWRYEPSARDLAPIKTQRGQTTTVFYLYDDPVAVAGRLNADLAREWAVAGVEGLLAAPFEIVDPLAIEKHLP
jgi:hypothetical protein